MMIEDFRTCSLKWRRNYGKKSSSPENKEIQWKTASQLSISKCVLVACYFSFRKKNTSFSLNHNKKSATTKPKTFPKFSQQKQLPISPKHLHLPLKNSSGNTHPIRPNHHNHHNRIFGNETNQPPGGKQNRSYVFNVDVCLAFWRFQATAEGMPRTKRWSQTWMPFFTWHPNGTDDRRAVDCDWKVGNLEETS